MKYIVELGYKNSYEFDDPSTAVNFAEMALTHKTEHGEYDYIEIKVKREDDNEHV